MPKKKGRRGNISEFNRDVIGLFGTGMVTNVSSIALTSSGTTIGTKAASGIGEVTKFYKPMTTLIGGKAVLGLTKPIIKTSYSLTKTKKRRR